MPDFDAIRAVIATAASADPESDRPAPDALDFGAALVLLEAARLDVDRLEYELLQAVLAAGLTLETVAAVLDVPADHAEARLRRLRGLAELPVAEESDETPSADEDRDRGPDVDE